jgi:hypothetical protein
MKQYLIRLDRIAGELNVWLIVIAIGLGILNLTVLIAKCMPALPQTPAAAAAEGLPHSAAQPPSSQTSDERS